MSKQDRQGVRRPADLEQKYSFGNVFKEQSRENAQQNSQMNQQRITMSQFMSFASEAIDTLQKDMDAAEKLIAILKEGMSAMDTKMKTAEGNISEHGDRLDVVEKSVKSLNTKMKTVEATISKHGKTLSEHNESLSSLAKKLTVAEEDIGKLDERIKKLGG